MEEEARLFYVAVTRARTQLILVQCGGSSGLMKVLPSRFIHRLLAQEGSARQPCMGMAVCHSTYGKGIITALDLEKDRVTIQFQEGVQRTYLASYLNKPEVFSFPE